MINSQSQQHRSHTLVAYHNQSLQIRRGFYNLYPASSVLLPNISVLPIQNYCFRSTDSGVGNVAPTFMNEQQIKWSYKLCNTIYMPSIAAQQHLYAIWMSIVESRQYLEHIVAWEWIVWLGHVVFALKLDQEFRHLVTLWFKSKDIRAQSQIRLKNQNQSHLSSQRQTKWFRPKVDTIWLSND